MATLTLEPRPQQPETFANRLFGELAIKLYMTTRRNLDRAIRAQREARAVDGDPSLGEVMVGLGFLTEKQVELILRAQTVYNDQTVEALYGQIAIKNRFLTRSNLNAALKIQKRTGGRLRLGEVLVKKGILSWETHETILRAQERLLDSVKK